MEGINVLSLFDGMGCSWIALKEAGIPVNKAYASEIDSHAIKQTQLNFPDTVQLGDVTKWREWNIDWKSLDLILAGSPCQGFSFAGKQLAFDDPRSKLFFVFIDILNHVRSFNPNVLFLLENVNMKKSHMRVISEYCGVFPVNINSNLVSAQNRDRWYWTNIRTKQIGLFGELHSDIPQPADKGILLRDVLEEVVDEKYYVSQAVIDRMNKPHKCFTPQINPSKTGCLTTKNNSGQMSFDSGTTFISIDSKSPTQRAATGRLLDKKHNYQFIKINIDGNISKNQKKSSCFTAGAHSGGNHSDMDLICVAMHGREYSCLTPKRTEYGKSIRKDYEAGKIKEERVNIQQLEPRLDNKTNCLTSVQKDNLILQRSRGNNAGGLFEGKTPTLSACSWEQNNMLCISSNQKHATISLNKSTPMVSAMGMGGGHVPMITSEELQCKTDIRIRRLTPVECSRLQTIPSWYQWKCSDTQIYKMLGNGWTVDVIAHILSFMNIDNNDIKN